MLLLLIFFAAAHADALVLKRHRVLLIAGDQMRDDRVIRDASDFGDIAALLKIWGIPFDIMRLATHRMTKGDFVDTDGARYGVIIWTAGNSRDLAVMTEAVARHHISFIAVTDKIQDPEVQRLLGLTCEGDGPIVQPQMNPQPHFITRGVAGAASFRGPRVTVANRGTAILAAAGERPVLTARTLHPATRTRAVWIGGDPDVAFHTDPVFIRWLQRSIVWAQGYALMKDWKKTVVLRMDDPGGAQSSYLGTWRYPQLNRDTIRRSLIIPLIEHNAFLGVGFNPGFVWAPTQTIARSTEVNFVDPSGVRQDIVSTCSGLRDGIYLGAIEIQSHGLTHMQPDLDTWWGGDTTERNDVGWYREFYDVRRDREIDSATQSSRLRQSSEWIADAFGQRPLTFIPGGHAISGARFIDTHIADNYTYALAADAGYGLALDQTAHYLGKDYVITMKACVTDDLGGNFARGVPAVWLFHDKDIHENPLYLAEFLSGMDGDVRYMSMDEWTAALHTKAEVRSLPGGMELAITTDSHYGRYFGERESPWALHLSDEVLADLRRHDSITPVIDGISGEAIPIEYFSDRMNVSFSPGIGTHHIRFSWAE